MKSLTKIRIGAFSILLLVVVVAVTSFWTIRNLTRAYSMVNHTNQVLEEIASIPSLTKDTVSGARGYFITGNKIYLQTYSAAITQVEPHVKNLHDLTVDNRDQHRRADELGEMIEEEVAVQRKIVALRDSGESGAQIVTLIDSGKHTMDNIRTLSDQMRASETLLLNERIDTAEHRAEEVMLAILAISGLAMLFVGSTYYVARLEHRSRDAAAKVLYESEEKTRLILNSIAEGIYTIDLEGRCTGCNPACLRMLEYENESKLIGKKMHDITHHTGTDGMPIPIENCRIFNSLQSGRGFHADDEVFWRSDGTNFPVEYWSYPIRRDGKITGAVVTILDITARKNAETESRQSNEMLADMVRALERSGDEVSRLSQMGGMLQSCLTLEEAYTVISRVAPGLFPEESGAVFSISPSRDAVEAVVTWGDSLAGEKSFVPDDCWALRSGHPHQVERGGTAMACNHVGSKDGGGSYLCIPMMAQGEASGVLHLQFRSTGVGSLREHFKRSKVQLARTVAEHIALAFANLKLRDALRAQSIRDTLTGLFNRRFMEETLEKELKRAARNSKPVSVILLDVDHFKRYNDTYGHEAGDAVLREMGNFLKTQVRGEDIACRYGGEEFLLIMPDAALEIAAQRAERMRQGAKRIQISSQGKPLGAVTISLGVSAFPGHGKLPDALLRSADAALYDAKQQGRDRAVVATAAQEEPAET